MSLLLLGGMALQGYMGYKQASQQAKMNNILGKHKQKIQDQNNAAARQAGNDKQTVTTLNIQRAMQQYVNADASIDVARMKSRAASIVNSAAAGTAGMSVDDSIMDIERNAAKAEANEMYSLTETVSELERSRRQTEAEVQSRTTNNLFLPTPAPSALGAAVNAGVNYATTTYGSEWDAESLGVADKLQGLGSFANRNLGIGN